MRPRRWACAYSDAGVRTSVRTLPGDAGTFIEFCLQVFFQRFFIAPTGVRLRRWLDKHYTDYYYRNHFIYIMDDTINDSQGRLSGGGMQT